MNRLLGLVTFLAVVTLTAFLGLSLVNTPKAHAAAAPTYTQGPDTLWRDQSDPTFATDGSLASAVRPFFYKATFTNTTDPTDKFDKNLGQVNVDFIKDAAKTVTIGGKTYTYGEVEAAMLAIGAKEWAALP